jgi:hypothetical protein
MWFHFRLHSLPKSIASFLIPTLTATEWDLQIWRLAFQQYRFLSLLYSAHSVRDSSQFVIHNRVTSSYSTIHKHIIGLPQRRDSSIGTATGYGLDGRGWIRGRGKDFSHVDNIKTGYGTHPASYPMCTGREFLWGKATGAWSWPLTSI